MKVAVRYYTRSGNTKKLADQIAKTVGVKAEDVSVGLKEDVDILFLGSSVYAIGVDEEVKKFVENINVKVGYVVNFSTAAIIKSTYAQVKKLLDAKGIRLHEKEYHCKGSFGIMHKGRPNASDLKEAAEFAKSIIK
jgi:flavodoxin